MTFDEARQKLRDAQMLEGSGKLHSNAGGGYVFWNNVIDGDLVCLDGDFGVDLLEAIVVYVRSLSI